MPRLDDRGLWLRFLLDVSLPSVCSILRSGPSGTLQHSDFHTAVGGRELDSNLPMPSSLKSVFLLAAGLLLLLLELSSLTKLWYVDSLSRVTTCYTAEHYPAPMVSDVDWSAFGNLLVDLHLEICWLMFRSLEVYSFVLHTFRTRYQGFFTLGLFPFL